ncbi:hypothetical protein FA15DRAFT_667648 [Coprinopsis marcescibilis]|uniref:Uncharacterized protein n=1 Tax=Coprinopsis marcescibilis TaxID=230819 RepID=A0A5C3LD58_COPMA|nr:hypothetical protein FA15DRAFT_667648 [Coprinopsis marcescibilis]
MGFQFAYEGLGAVNREWPLANNVDSNQWWRTPVDLWAYTLDGGQWAWKPPPHSYLVSHQSAIDLGTGHIIGQEDDLRLDPALAGVCLAQDIMKPYEKAVGIDYTLFPEIDHSDLGLPPPLNLVPNEDVEGANQRWTESLREFISAVREPTFPDGEESMSYSFTESEHSSGSDNSTDYFAMPSTPPGQTGSFPSASVKIMSPNSSINSVGIDDDLLPSPAPVKALNAFATSFIPSFSPPANTATASFTSINDSLNAKASAESEAASTPREPLSKSSLCSLSSFTFPTLNPPATSTTRLTTVKIRKDEQGFYTDVHVDEPSFKLDTESSLLPPFLQESTPARRSRTSRTRELVDRLRSSQSESPALLDDPEAKKPSLDMPFDLLPKSLSQSPTPHYREIDPFRSRGSLSEDGGNSRDSVSSTPTPSQEDDDGWINVTHSGATTASSVTSSVYSENRTRDLMLALSRRRKDSSNSEPVTKASSPVSRPDSLPARSSADGGRAPRKALAESGFSPQTREVRVNSESGLSTMSEANPTYAKPTPPANHKPTHNRKKVQHNHRQSSHGSSSSFSYTRPPFMNISNPPYMNMPMATPTPHPNMIPSVTAAPVPYYFSAATPAYYPAALAMPLAFAPVGFLPTSPYASPPTAVPRGMQPGPTAFASSPMGPHGIPMIPFQHHRKGSLPAW